MTTISATVASTIAAPRGPFWAWLIPGVFFTELHTVLRDAAFMPGVERTVDTTGPWDVPGSSRVIHTTDGNTVRETVTAAVAPDYFSYRVTEFSSPLIRRLVSEARGQWWFSDAGAGTHAKWTYSFDARAPWAVPLLLPMVKVLWSRYMKAAMDVTKQRAEGRGESGVAVSEWDFDLTALHGPQGVTAEDRAYAGSRYAEVRDAIFKNPYRLGRSGESPGPLPMYRSAISHVWKGVLPFTGPDLFSQASARSIDSHADLRWGPDGRGFRRMLSPNGICVFGKWEITEDTPYSGYFSRGAAGLFIGRYSSDGNETMRGQRRSLSLAGKIYPTLDPDHPEPLRTAGFMSQEDLGGMKTDYINDAELRNAPNVTAYRRGIYFLIMVRAGMVFPRLDKVGDSRMLYEIAELGKPEGEPTRSPWHMMLKMTPGQPRIQGERLDFRDEVYQHIFRPGESEPSGQIEFDISVSDTAKTTGIPGFRRVQVSNWQRIGRLTLTEAVASFNGDHVVQFHHPGWRENPNDPSTAIRRNERRVRK